MNTQSTVTRTLVPKNQRLAITEKPAACVVPDAPRTLRIHHHRASVRGLQRWLFGVYQLSNGGFYMAPAADRLFHVICKNQFEGDLTADALGITACLYA